MWRELGRTLSRLRLELVSKLSAPKGLPTSDETHPCFIDARLPHSSLYIIKLMIPHSIMGWGRGRKVGMRLLMAALLRLYGYGRGGVL